METNTPSFFKRITSLESLTYTVLMVLLIVVPVFFIPSVFVSPSFAKSVLFSIGTIVSLALFLVALIKQGNIVFSKNPVVFGLGALALVYLVSSLFSNSVSGSFFGYGFETSTFVGILLGAVLAYLVSVSFTDQKKIFSAIVAFLCVSGLLVIFQTILTLFIGSNSFSQGSLLSFISNTIGKTNELAVFFGISALISLVALEILKLNKLHRVVLYVLLVLSLFVVAVVNFMTVWYVLCFVSTCFFFYQILFLNAVTNRMKIVQSAVSTSAVDGAIAETRLQSPRRKIAFKTLIFVAISFVFVIPSFFGYETGHGLSVKFGINSLEVRPSAIATYQVFRGAIASRPITGSGPNRFGTQWQLYRPDVNASSFWNVNFDFGIGFIPTALVETGILGVLAWGLFLILLLYVGFRALYARSVDIMTRYLNITLGIVTLYLWILNIVYILSPALFMLTFFFTGLFVASSILAGVGTYVRTSLVGRPKTSFVVVVIAVCVLIPGVALGYTFFQNLRSSVYFQKGVQVLNVERDPNKSEALTLQALAITKNDIYYRTIAAVEVLKLNNLIAGATGKTEVSDAEKRDFQTALGRAIEASRAAIQADPTHYENREISGKVYETLAGIQMEGSYESAKASYVDALKLSPRNPALYFALARVEAAKNNLADADAAVQKALDLKWNYPEAAFLQSQIDVARGNLPAAIKSAQQLSVLAPNDPSIFFRLGLLQYQAKDYAAAVKTFEQSLSLVPVYANAKYFLGLSYAKVGRNAAAIAQFEDLKTTNPEATEINTILANLRKNKDPFANDAADAKPEKRKKLPVSEKN